MRCSADGNPSEWLAEFDAELIELVYTLVHHANLTAVTELRGTRELSVDRVSRQDAGTGLASVSKA